MSRGGWRPGSGRKLGSKNKKPKQPRLLNNDLVVPVDDAVASDAIVDLMKKIALDPNIDAQLRLEAAKSVAPYLVARIGVRPPAETTNSDKPAQVVVVQPFRAGFQVGPKGEQLTPDEAGPVWKRFRESGQTGMLFGPALAIDNDPPISIDDHLPDGAA